jgi:DNA-binding NarL/FixJ family response regulator
MKPTRLLIADDHALLRAGIRSLAERLPGVTCVGEAGDGRAALQLIAATRPDVVLLDITMPGLNGLQALARITHDFPRVKVLILTMHANEEYVVQSLRGGAAGFLLKNSPPEEFALALESVASGRVYLSPLVGRHVAEYLRRTGAADDPLPSPTLRQREVLQLVAEGRTNKEIAATLGLSVKTVEMHRGELMRRLDVHDLAGLVRYAIRTGLFSLEG